MHWSTGRNTSKLRGHTDGGKLYPMRVGDLQYSTLSSNWNLGVVISTFADVSTDRFAQTRVPCNNRASTSRSSMEYDITFE